MPKPPPRPTSLRIGYADWTIHWFDEKAWAKHNGKRSGDGGLTYGSRHVIEMRAEILCEAELRQVLLHEVLHACTSVSAIEPAVKRVQPKDIEETFVAAVAPVLLAVLRDNPALDAWLLCDGRPK